MKSEFGKKSYSKLVSSIPGIIYQVDSEGKLEFIDNSIREIGYEPSNLTEQPMNTIIFSENQEDIFEDQLLPKYRNFEKRSNNSLNNTDDLTNPNQSDQFQIYLLPKQHQDTKINDEASELPAYQLTASPVYEGNDKNDFSGVAGVISPIGDTIKQKNELNRKNDFLHKAEDIAEVGGWEYDLRTEEEYGTDKVKEIYGTPKDITLSTQEAIQYYHPEDRPTIEQAFEKAINEGDSYDLTLRLIDENDQIRWVRTRGEPQYDDGEIIRVRGTIQDVTKQKKTERELEEERDLVSGILDTSPVGISVIDKDGDHVFVNQRSEDIAGWSSEDTVETSYDDPRYDLVNEDGEPLATDKIPYEKVLNEETMIQNQVIGVLDDSGQRIWLSVNGAPMWNDDGELKHAIFTYEDVTERKKNREEIQRQNNLISSVRDLLFVIDPGTAEIEYVTETTADKLGYEKTKLESMILPEIAPEIDSLEKWHSHVNELQQYKKQLYEAVHSTKDGTHFPVEVSYRFVDGEDGNKIVATARNITEQKERERQLRELNERLELAVEGSELGIWDWDMTNDEVEFNEQWAQMIGYSLEEIEPHLNAWEKRVHPEDIDEVKATLEAHIAGETEYYDSEHRLRTADGDWKWIRDLGKIFKRNDDGDPVRAVGIHLDIDDRKKQQAKIKEQRKRFESLFEQAPLGLWEEDWSGAKMYLENLELPSTEDLKSYLNNNPDLIKKIVNQIEILLPNQRVVDMLSAKGKEHLKHNFKQVLTESSYKAVQEELLALWEGGVTSHTSENTIETFDGEQKEIRRDVQLVPGREADWSRVFVSYQDVTERKTLRRNLKRNQAFLEELNEISTRTDIDLETKIDNILRLGCEQLDCSYGFLTKIKDNFEIIEQVVGDHDFFHTGVKIPLSMSYCRKTIEQNEPLVLNNASDVRTKVGTESYDKVQLDSYIGAKLHIEEEVFGTVCFASNESRDIPFGNSHEMRLRHIIEWIKFEMERKERIQKLRQRTRAIEEAPVGITITDPNKDDNPINYVNEEFEQITGYSSEEVVGQNCRFLQSDATDSSVLNELRKAIDSQEPIRTEIMNERKDGTQFWNRMTIAPIKDEQGKLECFIGFQEDITADKETRKAMQRHNEMIRSVRDSLFLIEPETAEIQFVTENTADKLGYVKQELMGMTIPQVDPELDSMDKWEPHVAELRESDSMILETTHRRKDGSTFPVEVSTRYVKSDDGDRIVATARNISERKKRISKLKQRTRAIEDAPIGVTISDPQQDDNPLLYANKAFKSLTGYSQGEIVEKNCRFLQGEDTNPDTVSQIRQAIESTEPLSVELKNYKKDGTEFWNKLTISPVHDEQGTVKNWIGFQQDITGRKRKEIQLKESRQRYRQLANNVEAVLWMIDLKSEDQSPMQVEPVYVSAKYEEIWKRPTEEFEQNPQAFLEAVVEEDQDKVKRAQESIAEGNYDLEYRIETPDGEVRWIHDRAYPINNVKGETNIRVAGIAEDITERKLAKKKIQESEERFRRMAENITLGYWLISSDWSEVYYANEVCADMYGVPYHQLNQNPQALTEHILKEDLQHLQSILSPEQTKQLEEVKEVHLRIDHPKKGLRHLKVKIHPIRNEDKTEKLIGVAEDITEQVKAEQQIHRNEERFRQLAENIDAVFWLTDPEKTEMLYVNEKYDEIWGRSPENLREAPNSFLNSIHPEDRDYVKSKIPDQIEGNYDVEYRVQRPDGSIRWVRDRAFPVHDENGEVYRIAGIAEDITESKERETRLQKTLQEKKTLLKEVHHRVKNNMQIMASIMSLQKEQVKNEQLKQLLTKNQNRLQAMKLIHQHLMSNENISKMDFESYIERLLRQLISAYSSENFTIQYQLECDNIELPFGKSLYCGLILQELTTNSFEHGFSDKETGTIFLKLEKYNENEVKFVYEDNGSGLPDGSKAVNSGKNDFDMIEILIEKQLDTDYEYKDSDSGISFEFIFEQ